MVRDTVCVFLPGRLFALTPPASGHGDNKGSFDPASGDIIDDVIDPVQSEKPDENQIDSHCEAHDPGRNLPGPR